MSHQENLTSIHLFIFYSFSLDGGYMEGLSLTQLPLAGRWGTAQTSRHLSDGLTDRQSTIHTVIHTYGWLSHQLAYPPRVWTLEGGRTTRREPHGHQENVQLSNTHPQLTPKRLSNF